MERYTAVHSSLQGKVKWKVLAVRWGVLKVWWDDKISGQESVSGTGWKSCSREHISIEFQAKVHVSGKYWALSIHKVSWLGIFVIYVQL